jgi:hypothetical protein
MMSVRIVTRDANGDADEGFNIHCNPNDPASIARAQAELAKVLGMEQAPAMFGGGSEPDLEIGRALAALFRPVARLFRGTRPGHVVAPSC